MKKSILSIATFLVLHISNAQVNTLIFNHHQGLFTDITSYPNMGLISHSLNDDYVLPSKVDIPFTFSFGGILQDSVNISENGFIWFGKQDSTMHIEYSPISAVLDTAVKGIISALGTDLQPHKHLNLPTSLKSGAVGYAPNRIFIIQWQNTSRFQFAQHGDTLSFQIKLYESTNEIEFAYGFFGIESSFYTPTEVGLKGATHSDFNNRAIISGNWSNTSSGTWQGDACNLNIMTKPTFGQLFRWNGTTTAVPTNNYDTAGKVYPNPFHTEVNVNILAGVTPVSYRIHSLAGVLIKEGKLSNKIIDVSDISKGAYILTIENNGTIYKEIIIKQ